MAESCGSRLLMRLARRKYIASDQITATQLKRCLTTLDLTALGIGSTLGLGIYVLAGKVAKESAGPSVTLSFLIAAIASVFAGLCYAEFGARVPRTGSAYVYSYVTVGELIAFIIGWNLIMEYVIGTASVAKGYSDYLDFLLNNAMNATLRKVTPMHVEGLAPYPDFLASGLTLFLAIILAVGVKESSFFNNVFTFLNLLVVLYVIICGSFKADPHNWNLSQDEVTDPKGGTGGFFPFGLSGMLAGAATCFYGFVGFDCIATTGEEVKNPQKAIPISIILSLLFIFLAYFGVSTITTLMWPYYLQDVHAPLPHVFDAVGWPVAKWIVSIGALIGLSTSLLGAMFPLPRIIYAMSVDGLIFRKLSAIHPKYKTPLLATIVAGLLTALLAMLLSLDELIEMMSIGTLMAYSIVSACVLLLRYTAEERSDDEIQSIANSKENFISGNDEENTNFSFSQIAMQYFNFNRLKSPSHLTSRIVSMNVRILVLFTTWLAASFLFMGEFVIDGKPWAIALMVINILCVLVVFISIAVQPQDSVVLSFKVPWVPFIPWLSLFINICLMLKLKWMTWVRFAIWLFIGMLIYVFYGIKESTEEYRQKGLPPPSQDHEDSEEVATSTPSPTP